MFDSKESINKKDINMSICITPSFCLRDLAKLALHLRHPLNGLLRSAIRIQSYIPESVTPSAAYALSCIHHIAFFYFLLYHICKALNVPQHMVDFIIPYMQGAKCAAAQ